MQFIGTGDRILTENFNVGYLYTITFKSGNYINTACIGIGDNFVMFQRIEPDLLFTLNVDTAEDVDTIVLYDSGGGISDYDELSNRPQINSHTLTGNMSGSELGLQDTISDLDTIRAGAAAGATAVQPAALSDYQPVISDLDTIRAGASAGATSVQPADMTSALAAKQDVLSAAQLAAVNSGITSTDVAQIEMNKNNISYNMNQGVKNLAPNTLASGSISWGVTATVNSDGSVVLSGSTPSDHDAVFQLFPNRQFKAGKYSYSGCPSGGEINKWRIDIVINDTMVYRDIGSGIEFTINEDSNIRTQIVIYRGNSAPTADFKPMLKQYGDDTYQPYAMSNAELTAAIQALQEQLANLANQ